MSVGKAAGSLALVLLGCAEPQPALVERTAAPAPAQTCAPSAWDAPRVDVVATGLETPWAMSAAADGRVFLTERAGRVRVMVDGALRAESWAELPVAHVGESGLLGVVPAPDFAESGALFVAGVYPRRSRALPLRLMRRALRSVGVDPGTDFELRVHRLPANGNGAGAAELVVTGIPASPLHPGGALHFIDDSTFLLSVGDSRDPWTAQDTTDPRGSILRVHLAAGALPVRFGDAATAVATGVRNPQGIVRLGATDQRLFIDHGPTGAAVEGGRVGRDELNVLTDGDNYGWPEEAGIHADARFAAPIHEWTAAIAPAGMAVLPADSSAHAVFVTGLAGHSLSRVEIARAEGAGWRRVCESQVLDRRYGRLRAITPHPEEGLLVATSNRDSRGVPQAGDDRILWVRPGARQ